MKKSWERKRTPSLFLRNNHVDDTGHGHQKDFMQMMRNENKSRIAKQRENKEEYADHEETLPRFHHVEGGDQ